MENGTNETISGKKMTDRSLEARWGKVGRRFTAIPNALPQFAHMLDRRGVPGGSKGKGLTPTEMAVIINLATFWWDTNAPYPALKTLAERIGVSTRAVRSTLEKLEAMGYLRREFSKTGGPSKYHMEGLVTALNDLDAVVNGNPRKTQRKEAES